MTLPPPLPERASHPLRSMIAWVVILATVFYVMSRVIHSQSGPAGKATTESLLQDTRVTQLRLSAKADVALHNVGANAQQPETKPISGKQLKALDDLAESASEKINVAIVAGEVAGGPEALDRLLDVQTDDPALRSDIDTLEMIYAADPTVPSMDASAELLKHRGWFGQLALAYGRPAFDSYRIAVNQSSRRVLIYVTALGVGLLCIGGAAIVLFVLACILLATRVLKCKYAPAVVPSGKPLFLEAFAIYLAGYIGISWIATHLISASSSLNMPGWLEFSIYGVAALLLPLGLFWPVMNGLSRRESLRGFGWIDGRHIVREGFLGIVGYVALLPIPAIGLCIAMVLSRHAKIQPTHPIMQEISKTGWPLLGLYALACVFAPIMEESMFRGALFNHLRSRGWGFVLSALTIGVLFAAIHPQGWTFIPALGAIGVSLACIREWRGSIIASMFAHAFNNGLVLTLAHLAMRM